MENNGLSVNTNAGDVLGGTPAPTLAPPINVNKIIGDGGGPNYTPTKNPNVVMGKYGVPITKAQFEHANANGYAWKDFNAYADYVGGWAKPINNPVQVAPVYRAYGGTPNISGADVAVLAAKNDPQINQIIQKNIGKPGEVPMYAAEDADKVRALIQRERNAAIASHLN